MMQGQQQYGLPYSTTQLEIQPSYIDQNTPPVVPQYATHQMAQPYIPLIAALAAMEVQNNATANRPLRIFCYNLMARNNWRNEEFLRLVTAIVDWLVVSMLRQEFQSPQAAIQTLVPRMVEMVACAQLRNFEPLGRMVDSGTFNRAQQLIQVFDGISSDIQRAMQPQQAVVTNRGGGSWASEQMAAQGAAAGGWVVEGARSGIGTDGTSNNSSLFSGARANDPYSNRFNDRNQPIAEDRYSRRNAELESRRKPETRRDDQWEPPVQFDERRSRRDLEQQESLDPRGAVLETMSGLARGEKEVAKDLFILADESEAKWRPFRRQPYALAYNPATHLLYHKVLPTGEVVEVLQERIPGTVDYEKHRVSLSFGVSPRRYDEQSHAAKMERLLSAMQIPQSTELPELDGEEVSMVKNRVIDPAWVTECTQETCWIVGRLGWVLAAEGKDLPGIYHRKAKVLEPFVSDKDERDTIKQLGAQEDYVSLRSLMLKLGDAMSPELWTWCERKMTEAVNRVLVQQLSIGHIRIKSFVADIGDLVQALRDNVGDLFADAFANNEARTIRNTFSVLDESLKEVEDVQTESFLTNYNVSEGQPPIFTYVNSNVTMTYLTLTSQELNVELNPKVGAMVMSNTPFLRELAVDIFKNVAAGEDEFDRHFVRTADGRIIELTVGLVSDDAYLARLIR